MAVGSKSYSDACIPVRNGPFAKSNGDSFPCSNGRVGAPKEHPAFGKFG